MTIVDWLGLGAIVLLVTLIALGTGYVICARAHEHDDERTGT